MSTVILNLSRKWRSQDFGQIVGQDLVVRILKNSLYLGHYFPVYLFAGQRGCGKTSTARIFAAAVNCRELPFFQKNPKKSVIPCLVCDSCIAMRDGNHPDFLEIDAASHTGVDNIRAVIESSTLLPLIGRKRVYLIDEAHMLSKAAFNAALKILEEPPSTALFILATTNQNKIIDTVRSRCFQLFFVSIPYDSLKSHIAMICKSESISYTDDALDLIVRHTEGSARDALNLLEQVRFANSIVSKETVLSLLGHIGDQHIVDLISLTVRSDAVGLIKLFQLLQINQQKAEFVWQRMVVILRALIWIKYGVNSQEIVNSSLMLEATAQWCTVSDLHYVVETLHAHEELFFKTAMQHIFLEMILLNLCRRNKKKSDDGDGSVSCTLEVVPTDMHNDQVSTDDQDDGDDTQNRIIDYNNCWQLFVAKSETLNDSLLHSLFKQAHFTGYDVQTHKVSIEVSKDLILFKELVDSKLTAVHPLLYAVFSPQALLNVQFTGPNKLEKDKKQKSDVKEKTSQSQSQEQFRAGYRYNGQKASIAGIKKNNESAVDVSDEHVWKKASMLMRHFPGIITEIRENR